MRIGKMPTLRSDTSPQAPPRGQRRKPGPGAFLPSDFLLGWLVPLDDTDPPGYVVVAAEPPSFGEGESGPGSEGALRLSRDGGLLL